MKLYKATIRPTSTFGTKLKGDTLFGQMCWAVRYALGKNRLEELLSDYDTVPFLIVSDAYTSGYLPKPSLPSSLLGEDPDTKKENRKKRWLKPEALQRGKYREACTDKEAGNKEKTESVVKNSLSYKSFSTKDAGFDPYAEDETYLSRRDIYFLINDDKFASEELQNAFRLLSQMGYGKNSSTGRGRFVIEDFCESDLASAKETNTYMALSPISIEGLDTGEVYYSPFVRFGKHGGDRANKNTFKKPILLADSASVIVWDEKKELQYAGSSIRGHSAYSDTVHQGYSIVVPLEEIQ